MDAKQVEMAVNDLEVRLERLRQLYDQYFNGFEKVEPTIARKDVDRKFQGLHREQIRNTAVRFRFQVMTQRYNTFQTYWQRICRQIELGTYERHVNKAKKKYGMTPSMRPSALADPALLAPKMETDRAPPTEASLVAAQPVAQEPASTPRSVPISGGLGRVITPAASAPGSAPGSVHPGALTNQAKRIVIRKSGTKESIPPNAVALSPGTLAPMTPRSMTDSSAQMRSAPPVSQRSAPPPIRPREPSRPTIESSPPPLPPPRQPQASYVEVKVPGAPPTIRNPGAAPPPPASGMAPNRPPPIVRRVAPPPPAPAPSSAPRIAAPPPAPPTKPALSAPQPVASEARMRSPGNGPPPAPGLVKDSESRLREKAASEHDANRAAARPLRGG